MAEHITRPHVVHVICNCLFVCLVYCSTSLLSLAHLIKKFSLGIWF